MTENEPQLPVSTQGKLPAFNAAELIARQGRSNQFNPKTDDILRFFVIACMQHPILGPKAVAGFFDENSYGHTASPGYYHLWQAFAHLTPAEFSEIISDFHNLVSKIRGEEIPKEAVIFNLMMLPQSSKSDDHVTLFEAWLSSGFHHPSERRDSDFAKMQAGVRALLEHPELLFEFIKPKSHRGNTSTNLNFLIELNGGVRDSSFGTQNRKINARALTLDIIKVLQSRPELLFTLLDAKIGHDYHNKKNGMFIIAQYADEAIARAALESLDPAQVRRLLTHTISVSEYPSSPPKIEEEWLKKAREKYKTAYQITEGTTKTNVGGVHVSDCYFVDVPSITAEFRPEGWARFHGQAGVADILTQARERAVQTLTGATAPQLSDTKLAIEDKNKSRE